MIALIVIAVVAVLVLVTLARTIRIVPQARAGVIERLGRYNRTLTPGLAIVVPFIDRLRQPVSGDDAVVVETHQLDYVQDVGFVLDAACSRPLLAREDRVIDDPPLLFQLEPDVLRKREVGGMVAVQVAHLPAAELECELAPPSGPRLDARPSSDFLGDPLACCGGLGHGCLLRLRFGSVVGHPTKENRSTSGRFWL